MDFNLINLPFYSHNSINLRIGYNISHTWKPDLSKEIFSTLSCTVTSQAYMDDTTWMTHTKDNLEMILMIADDFYNLNNIKVNKKKSVLLVHNSKDYDKNSAPEVKLQFGNE